MGDVMARGNTPLMVRVKRSELAIGQRVPWTIYDAQHRVLVEKGTILKSEEDFNTIGLAGDLYRDSSSGDGNDPHHTAPLHTSIFDEIDHLETRMRNVLRVLPDAPQEVPSRILRLAERLLRYVKDDPDAAIGIAHLYHEGHYTELHPIHVAILALILADAKNYDTKKSLAVAAAALSKHISVARFQEELHEQTAPLTEQQRQMIHSYPQKSHDLLKEMGVKDSVWLNAVLQCQENEDGSGYPNGLHGDEISEEAKIVALADRYSAMISDRNYRKGNLSNSVLKRFFEGKGSVLNEELTLFFIKELGVYPPGTFVKLSDGYVGVVTKRGVHASKPFVSCYRDEYGKMLAKPFVRNLFRENVQIAATIPPQDIGSLSLKWIWGQLVV
jgi:HD-GYP domain-containing protein (c-di-GMP phosphodiesterase class II)